MYKDRGIMKWAPFDALNGFHETIEAYKYEKGKKDRPILLEDQLNLLDTKLKEAIDNNIEIQIYYYFDGYIKNVYGHVKRADRNFKYLLLDNGIKLSLEDVVDIIHLPVDDIIT
ncbi:MAG: YolD-like family protein [Acholeplasma sp.]